MDWMRSPMITLALAWVGVAIFAQCWLPQPHAHTVHPDHPLVTSLGAEFAVSSDHAHLSDNSTPACPEQFATAVLPRPVDPLFASFTVAVAAGLVGVLTYLVVPAGRGPPAGVVVARPGQHLLTRFCLARR
ncbi:hypothetical protein AWC15_11880 [Mycobacterium lacus]|nr:hypothetical protein [Mycobacterium lacus]MCV7121734.1 hypothetical protein [Mycobacterium lacus]ORW15168.1 hypothetical protein AWC15_11880 [Mycobacterium lacus]